jgi:hypothetical protein
MLRSVLEISRGLYTHQIFDLTATWALEYGMPENVVIRAYNFTRYYHFHVL